MTNRSMLALVISTGETIHNGLLALLTTIPCVSSVLVAQELEASLKLAESHQPAVIIMDMTFLEVQEVIGSMKEICSQAYLIIFVDDMDEKDQAQKIGADSVLIRGFQAKELIDIIESNKF
jgi:DNA-binding NarL/FixJ family response regulator